MISLGSTTIDALIAAVREAGQRDIMPRFRNLSPDMIDAKSGPDDLVTVADKAAEQRITQAIHQILPDAVVIGEEASATVSTDLSSLDNEALAVIIDPVDGTWNFAHGLALFGTILAVTRHGETVFGLIYDPVMDDWIMAEKGGGVVFATAGGRSYPVNATQPTVPMSGYIPVKQFDANIQARLWPALLPFDNIHSLKCSAHEYRTLAQGVVGFCITASLMPWDHAAGTLICTEAGGITSLIDGRRYTPGTTQGVLLTAANADIFAAIGETLGPILSARSTHG